MRSAVSLGVFLLKQVHAYIMFPPPLPVAALILAHRSARAPSDSKRSQTNVNVNSCSLPTVQFKVKQTFAQCISTMKHVVRQQIMRFIVTHSFRRRYALSIVDESYDTALSVGTEAHTQVRAPTICYDAVLMLVLRKRKTVNYLFYHKSLL